MKALQEINREIEKQELEQYQKACFDRIATTLIHGTRQEKRQLFRKHAPKSLQQENAPFKDKYDAFMIILGLDKVVEENEQQEALSDND